MKDLYVIHRPMEKKLYTQLHMVGVILVPAEAGNRILNENSNRGQHSVCFKITAEKVIPLGSIFCTVLSHK